MTILVLIGIGFLLWYSVIARLIVLHPFKTIYYGVRDLYFYFKHKQYNENIQLVY